MRSYKEEFERKYEQPYIGKVIVGFSGIDPSRKQQEADTGLSTEEVNELIAAYVRNLRIRIDSGNIDPYAEEPEAQYIPLRPSEISHEALGGLLGGDVQGHYHLTDEELWKLSRLIAVLFPPGSDDPVIPVTPTAPDNPSNPSGGLPRGTPPLWQINAFPSSYSAWYGVHRMYYGDVPYTKTSTVKTLLVPMKYGNTTTSRYLMRTTDLANWERVALLKIDYVASGTVYPSFGENIDDYVLLYGNNRWQLYVLGTPTNRKLIPYLYTTSTAGKITLTQSELSSQSSSYSITAGSYSSLLDIAVFAAQDGGITLVQDNKALTASLYKNVYCGLSSINPGCCAWSPEACVFCISGSGGTSTSSDGVNWSVHTDAPHNLLDMEYREDLHCFFARGGDDKLFYVSGNGTEWERLSSTPIPLETVTAVDYNADLGWYCAVGGTGHTAYFSKDLEHWTGTTITNGADIEAGSVIWMPEVRKYVLMPTSGNNYYTFSPSEWADE